MIRLEYPKFNIEGLGDSEKLSTIKRQLDTLTNNIQLVLESISGDVETLSEFVGNNNEAENSENISTITETITSITETIGELEDRDYIVEQGTSGIWTYRKWNSGIAECWGREEGMTITSGYVTLSSFPSNLFTDDTPNVASITPWYGSSSSRTPKVLFVTGTLGRVVYLRTSSNGVPTGSWSCFAEYKGRWK